jgi:hypothetical protein
MSVIAKRIGKSANESIIVDGAVYIKSCKIGLWNFVILTEINHYDYMTNEVIGRKHCIESKHRDIYSAKAKKLSLQKDLNKLGLECSRDYALKVEIIDVAREK